MDNIDEETYDEEKKRTLWVGNLHPNVTHEILAELFYQVGPLEYVEFGYDDDDRREHYAWVVFKYACSVEDSTKLFRGTKLYGLPIITKSYAKYLKDPVYDQQLNYFRQLISIKQNRHSTESNKNRWNDQSSIPDSLPEPPNHSTRNTSNRSNYDHGSERMSKHSSRHLYSKYQSSDNSYSTNYNDDSFDDPENPENSRSNSMDTSRDSYYNDRGSYRIQSYNSHDQRSKTHRKQSNFNSELNNSSSANTSYKSQFDSKRNSHHNKKKRYESEKHYESDSNNRYLERNSKNSYSGDNFSNKEHRKNNSNSSGRYNDSKLKRYSYSNERDPYDEFFNQEKTYDDYQKYNNDQSKKYGQGKNRTKSNYNRYNNTRSRNTESNNHQYNSHHPYKRNSQGF